MQCMCFVHTPLQASLASRLASLHIDYMAEHNKPELYEASILEGSESGYEESEDGTAGHAGSVASAGLEAESPMLRFPPFATCARLFINNKGPLQLKRLTMQQCEVGASHCSWHVHAPTSTTYQLSRTACCQLESSMLPVQVLPSRAALCRVALTRGVP
jgi:hypothetical protein